jgi:TRAP-type C4-dicarboxylate transport system permease small subunit
MLLVVANVIYRFFGHTIRGTYELIELIIIVPVAFALGYTAREDAHVNVTLLISRLPSRIRKIFETVNDVFSLAMWWLAAWVGIGIISTRWLQEETDMLNIPIPLFRLAWVIGLFFFGLVYLVDIINRFRNRRS